MLIENKMKDKKYALLTFGEDLSVKGHEKYNNRRLSIVLLLFILLPPILLVLYNVYYVWGLSSVSKIFYATFESEESNDDSDRFNTCGRKIVCYYGVPQSSAYFDDDSLLPQSIDPMLCTHLNIAFTSIYNHSIVGSDQLSRTIKSALLLKNSNHALKILISIGGGGNDIGFSDMVINHANRKEFIKSIKYFLKEHSLDGIDLDWEFPNETPSEDKKQRQHFSQLLREIRAEYIREKKDYLLSVAVAAPFDIVDISYDVGEINQYVDYVNVMTYDMHAYSPATPFTGLNSPLYSRSEERYVLSMFNVNYSIHYWIDKGLDRSKIVLGIPTYGHSFTLVNERNADIGSPASGFGKTGSLGFVSFYQVCQFAKSNDVVVNYNEEAMVPYLSERSEWISYENSKSIMEKAKYAIENELGGVMVFSLNADDFRGSCGITNITFPLTRIVSNLMCPKDKRLRQARILI